MSEKDMREILAGEMARERVPIVVYEDMEAAALRAMQEVERRTIERCAKGVERLRSQRVCAEVGPKAPDPLESEWYEALTDAVFAILALQDAPSDHSKALESDLRVKPSDDTPPAKEGV